MSKSSPCVDIRITAKDPINWKVATDNFYQKEKTRTPLGSACRAQVAPLGAMRWFLLIFNMDVVAWRRGMMRSTYITTLVELGLKLQQHITIPCNTPPLSKWKPRHVVGPFAPLAYVQSGIFFPAAFKVKTNEKRVFLGVTTTFVTAKTRGIDAECEKEKNISTLSSSSCVTMHQEKNLEDRPKSAKISQSGQ